MKCIAEKKFSKDFGYEHYQAEAIYLFSLEAYDTSYVKKCKA